MIATQSEISPPQKPPKVGLNLYDDYIRELGDRIANLTLEEAQELNDFLANINDEYQYEL